MMPIHIRRRAKPVVGLVILSLLWSLINTDLSDDTSARSLEKLLGKSMKLDIQKESFNWVRRTRPDDIDFMAWYPAVFLAKPNNNDLHDVFVADFKVTSKGGVRAFRRLTNLTRTTNNDEDILAVSQSRFVAFSGKSNGEYSGVTVLDFAGENPDLTKDWPRFWKIANGISNYQRTGRTKGINWKSFMFQKPSSFVKMSFLDADTIKINTDNGDYKISGDGEAGTSELLVQEMLKGQPAFLAWVVDTVRSIPWVGRRNIEWLEKIWFDLNDWLLITRYNLLGDSSESIVEETYVSHKENSAAVGIPGWPPPNIKPLLKKKKPLFKEGVWIPFDDDFVTSDTYNPPLFYKTFVRTDPKRVFARVHMTAWDPSMVELKMVAGVREPRSSTGNRGKGEIPRDGENSEIERLVGAFNGAFQALHGEWGMVVNRKILLPPRAYGATIGIYDDGTVAMGTWPHPVVKLPDDMRDLRQNVQPLVEGGIFNPYKRVWWGGVPQGIEERVVTSRSGICLTWAGKLVYFWGQHLSPESLGAAMVAGGCDYGVHLDMNSGHCGFEHYRVYRAGDQPPINRELDEVAEAEGHIPRRNDLIFRAKKMVKTMGNMRFPRYVARDPRDFFYLLKKKTIFDGARPPGGKSTWRPVGAKEGYPVFAVKSQLSDGASLYKFDPGQTLMTVEQKKPADALWAAPFCTAANGIMVGLMLEGQEVSPLHSGAPMLEIRDNGPVFLESAEEIDGTTVVQGVWSSMAQKVNVEHIIALEDQTP